MLLDDFFANVGYTQKEKKSPWSPKHKYHGWGTGELASPMTFRLLLGLIFRENFHRMFMRALHQARQALQLRGERIQLRLLLQGANLRAEWVSMGPQSVNNHPENMHYIDVTDLYMSNMFSWYVASWHDHPLSSISSMWSWILPPWSKITNPHVESVIDPICI